MHFPELHTAKESLVQALADRTGRSRKDIEVVASPYRICPLGAHIDHQGGPVLGMTIDAYTLLAFAPTDHPGIHLVSRNYPGDVTLDLDQVPESMDHRWGNYVRAAALALQQAYGLDKGVIGIVDGMLPGCGLSSSASVLLAYLYALSGVNHIPLSPWDYVRLTRKAENGFLGLNNGILDQTSIVFGKKDTLVHIDTIREEAALLGAPPGWSDYTLLIAYSGYSRELTTSGFNSRVRECREAAEALARMGHLPLPQKLSDIPKAVFEDFRHHLPSHLGRRAGHFFSEVERVKEGIRAWETGQLDRFGELMKESYQSSVEQYECGIPALYDLQGIVSSAEGMAGSRFMGGGFGGCVVGFVQKECAVEAAEQILPAYRKLHPEKANQAAVYLTQSADGIRFL